MSRFVNSINSQQAAKVAEIGWHFETDSIVGWRNNVRVFAAQFFVESSSLRHLEHSSTIEPMIYPTIAGGISRARKPRHAPGPQSTVN
jgi:hypothetical protein